MTAIHNSLVAGVLEALPAESWTEEGLARWLELMATNLRFLYDLPDARLDRAPQLALPPGPLSVAQPATCTEAGRPTSPDLAHDHDLSAGVVCPRCFDDVRRLYTMAVRECAELERLAEDAEADRDLARDQLASELERAAHPRAMPPESTSRERYLNALEAEVEKVAHRATGKAKRTAELVLQVAADVIDPSPPDGQSPAAARPWPHRARRVYSEAERAEILAYADTHGRQAAAQHFDINASLVDRWRRAAKDAATPFRWAYERGGVDDEASPPPVPVQDPDGDEPAMADPMGSPADAAAAADGHALRQGIVKDTSPVTGPGTLEAKPSAAWVDGGRGPIDHEAARRRAGEAV